MPKSTFLEISVKNACKHFFSWLKEAKTCSCIVLLCYMSSSNIQAKWSEVNIFMWKDSWSFSAMKE